MNPSVSGILPIYRLVLLFVFVCLVVIILFRYCWTMAIKRWGMKT